MKNHAESRQDETGLYPWPEVDFATLQRHRTDVVSTVMSHHGVDHLLLMSSDHIRYSTNYRTQLTSEPDWFAAVVAADGQAELFVPYVDEVVEFPDPGQPHIRRLNPVTSWSPAVGHLDFWVGQVAGSLARLKARSVGFDAVNPTLLSALRAALPDVAFVSVEAALFEARRVKHPLEIELLEATCRVNAQAMADALAFARAGMTDHQILAEAMRSQQTAGVEYVTHSVCNLRKGSGDWFAYGAQLREGDAFFFDIGCYGVGGYASDAARTGFIGEPQPRVLEAYQSLLEAHRLGQELCLPGVSAAQVHDEMNRLLADRGLRNTPYAIGHGIGLRLCELPTLYRKDRMDSDAVLREGETIALEPETSLEIDGKIVVLKVEDNFVVEANGLRALTTPTPLDDIVTRVD